MPLVETLGFSRNLRDNAMHRASQASSLQSWLAAYELEIRKSFTVPLAVHSVLQESVRAQKRISKAIARVPVAFLWLPVLANASFALLAIVIASLALRAARAESVHQVHIRLGVTGLIADLFERHAGERVGKGRQRAVPGNRKSTTQVEDLIQKTPPGGVAWLPREQRRRPILKLDQLSDSAVFDIEDRQAEHAPHRTYHRQRQDRMRQARLCWMKLEDNDGISRFLS
ncbi:hypothetical protein BKA66DRAFT_274279 [Pyrenochaeta sp. MPI-SDFR-AT-0127]|nr:hypothetical protein BKA66DRAFT_274279 [Pyrenochaeta sp. MPI-SDFR-AT-0127]